MAEGWLLALVATFVLLWCSIGRCVSGALGTGAAAGVVFYGVHLLWVQQFLGLLPWAALVGVEAVLFTLGTVPIALAMRWTAHWSPAGPGQLVVVPLLVAGLWVVREVVMGSWPYGGFAWTRLATTQVDGPLAELASWTGLDALTFVLVVLCAAVLQWARAGRRRCLQAGLLAASVVPLLGAMPSFPTAPAGQLRVGWVQGDGPAGSFDPRAPGDVLAAQLSASRAVVGRPMDLLVWPKGGVDSDPLHDPGTAATLDRLVDQVHAPLLINAVTQRGGRFFNTSLLWAQDPAARQLHDKRHPVPFGERVPDRWFYEALAPDLVGLLLREYTPGKNSPVVWVGEVRVGLAICFDLLHDDVVHEGVREGAEVLVFQTNGADFRGTGQAAQQLAIARMRAVETGRAVVVVATTGPSRVYTPTGTALALAQADVAASDIVAVPLRTGTTSAVVIGPWFGRVAGAGVGTLLGALGLCAARRGSAGRRRQRITSVMPGARARRT